MPGIKKELTQLNTFAKKSYGQNFLSNKSKIDKIAEEILNNSTNDIIEIGPGLGAITEPLVNKKRNIICIEKDKVLIENLKNKFKLKKNITLINEDVLKIDFKSISSENSIIVGNLPYNISTKILIKFVNELHENTNKGIFMFQREVADKIIAKKIKKNQLSSKIKIFYEVKEILKVNENDFWPPPKIKSSVLLFTPKKISSNNLNMKELDKFLQCAFFSNRKKIVNNLANKYDKDRIFSILKKLRINDKARPEEINEDILFRIFIMINNNKF